MVSHPDRKKARLEWETYFLANCIASESKSLFAAQGLHWIDGGGAKGWQGGGSDGQEQYADRSECQHHRIEGTDAEE